jgi:RNA polymerase sigma factor FliA
METAFVSGPRPSADDAEALWRRWHEHRDASARDRLVLSYAPMVKYLAYRKMRELPAHCDVDDLVSSGLLTLMSAVDRFDPTKGATFEQYAWTRVSGAIVDELRRMDWAPRSLRRSGRSIERARERWQMRHGRMPSDEELSNELEIHIDELRDALEGLSRADLLSLNTPARREDSTIGEVGDTVEAPPGSHDPEMTALNGERGDVLKAAVASLSDREQQIVRLLYVHGLQGAEIGRILGVSESRISQLMSTIRRRLKDRIEAYDSGSETLGRAA